MARRQELRVYADTSVFGGVLIVSWNIRHIVHFEKSRLYNAVNTLNGYGEIAIHSPLEVVQYEDQGL